MFRKEYTRTFWFYFRKLLNEEKTKAANTIEQIKKEHETNMNEIATKHEASLQVKTLSLYLTTKLS